MDTLARSAICRIVTEGFMMALQAAYQLSSLKSASRACLLRILKTTEAESSRTVHTGGCHQQLSMLVELVRLREVPDGSLRLVVAATAQDSAPCVLILKFFCPLPNVADKIHDSKWTCSLRMCIHRIWTSHGAALIRSRERFGVPGISPRVHATIPALGCILPLPLVREALPCPTGIRTRIFE